FFASRLRRSSTLFPYTMLFRSLLRGLGIAIARQIHEHEPLSEVEEDELLRASRGTRGACQCSPSCKGVDEAGLPYVRASGKGNLDRKSTRLNSSHVKISYAVFC